MRIFALIAGLIFLPFSIAFAQTLTEYPSATTASGPSGITQDSNGKLWFTMSNVSKLARTNFNGDIEKEFQLTTGSNPANITEGPDGYIWFTETGRDKIGKIPAQASDASEIVEYDVGDGPIGIVTGPDGNIWVTLVNANQIAKVTIDGGITVYNVPTAASQPYGITVGPNESIWFTEIAKDKIGRINQSGSITEFSVTAASAPRDIVFAKDGSLWFTQYNRAYIGKITSTGVVTDYPVSATAALNINNISAGPDGTPLWFTLESDNKIGQIAPSGAVTMLSTISTAASKPTDITLGPQGTVWFTEYDGNKIVKITPDDTLQISNSSNLASAVVGEVYSQQLQAVGGTAGYTYSLSENNALPDGLQISQSGLISGTPTTAGEKTFSVLITDSEMLTSSKVFSLNVSLPNLADLSVALKNIKRNKSRNTLTAKLAPINIGSIASPEVSVSVYLSKNAVYGANDKLVSNKVVSAMQATNKAPTINFSYKKSLKANDKFLIACIDALNAVSEQSETNNCDYQLIPR